MLFSTLLLQEVNITATVIIEISFFI